MRAAVLTAYNSPLQIGELPDPTPGPGEVLVRVMASGVNPLDTKIRRGEAAHAKMAPPAVLGIDMAGVVGAVGSQVDRFRVGDEVFGMTGGVGGTQGSLAELAAVDARLIAAVSSIRRLRTGAAPTHRVRTIACLLGDNSAPSTKRLTGQLPHTTGRTATRSL